MAWFSDVLWDQQGGLPSRTSEQGYASQKPSFLDNKKGRGTKPLETMALTNAGDLGSDGMEDTC